MSLRTVLQNTVTSSSCSSSSSVSSSSPSSSSSVDASLSSSFLLPLSWPPTLPPASTANVSTSGTAVSSSSLCFSSSNLVSNSVSTTPASTSTTICVSSTSTSSSSSPACSDPIALMSGGEPGLELSQPSHSSLLSDQSGVLHLVKPSLGEEEGREAEGENEHYLLQHVLSEAENKRPKCPLCGVQVDASRYFIHLKVGFFIVDRRKNWVSMNPMS
ncbi:unnamed protein product [Protopolystoma xenopodis]|uniref:Uncharacterized protein n=1 Tax=Protopolystoma xenopodis TaxID=117903 RepID=A0A3S5BW28_9PLAT|nr:unnamed protein product [Protopolystoma xenopodis]